MIDGIYNLYVGKPPFVADSDTSKAAAEQIAGDARSMGGRIFRLIAAAGGRGATCDEIEVATQYRHQTASARIRELALRVRIVDSGQRRNTRSNRAAVVWVDARVGRKVPEDGDE